MPAGLLPPRREKLFSDVSSRYLEIPHKEKQQYVPPERTTYDTQRAWANTNSRWADEPKDRPKDKDMPKPDVSDPLAAWKEAADHRHLARRAIGNVPARFAEDAERKGHPDVTPRDLVTKKDEGAKLEKGWRGTHALNKHTTFDVQYARFLKKHADEKFMQRKKNSARSPVADYVFRDKPIEATGRGGSPGRYLTPVPGANNSSRHNSPAPKPRSASPWERSVSPDSFIAGRWKGPGVSSSSFDRLKMQSMKMQPQMAMMEQHAHEAVAHVGDKKVDKSFVPRVYKLSLAMQLPESARSMSGRPASAANGDEAAYGRMYSIRSGSRSPNTSPNRRKGSPTRRL